MSRERTTVWALEHKLDGDWPKFEEGGIAKPQNPDGPRPVRSET